MKNYKFRSSIKHFSIETQIYIVSERKLAKLSFRAEREIFCLLKLLSLQISPFSRNDKCMSFRSDTIYSYQRISWSLIDEVWLAIFQQRIPLIIQLLMRLI